MNLGSFNWKLGYGSKTKNTFSDDQNSSLLFDEPDSPSFPCSQPSSAQTQPQTTILFSNDNAFDDFLSPPKSPLTNEPLKNSSKVPEKIKSKSPSTDFGDLLGDIGFSSFDSPTTNTAFKTSSSTKNSATQLDFGDFAGATEENSFGDFTDVELKSTGADDFGDFFSSATPKKSTADNKSIFGSFDAFTTSAIPVKTSRTNQSDSGLKSYASPIQTKVLDNISSYTNSSTSGERSHAQREPKKTNEREFSTDFWPELVKLVLSEFTKALLFLSDLDRVSSPKDRQLLGEYRPLKTYIEGLFGMIIVIERLRLSVQYRNLDPKLPPNDFEARTKWTNIRNLLMRLTISNPSIASPSAKDFHSVDSMEYCKVCFIPMAPKSQQSHFQCRALYLQIPTQKPSTKAPLNSFEFSTTNCQEGTLLL